MESHNLMMSKIKMTQLVLKLSLENWGAGANWYFIHHSKNKIYINIILLFYNMYNLVTLVYTYEGAIVITVHFFFFFSTRIYFIYLCL